MKSAPWLAAGSTSFHTDKTCSLAGGMETTTSAFSTQLLALATICTPSWAEVSREAVTTSKPNTRSPDLTPSKSDLRQTHARPPDLAAKAAARCRTIHAAAAEEFDVTDR
jgi:hypothetical protein